ncbi:MAG: hypothetical protein HYY04_04105 [Chloroflexi bacterium]|nr:hypothetical protein [Chloroflexota bacterium]
MNSRERFLSVMRFNAPDVVPLPCLFQCFETETIRRWHREGLRRDAHYVQQFGFERMELAPVVLGALPPLERIDIEESQEWRAGTDREHADETAERVDAAKEQFPIKSPAHWSAMLGRLNPESPARYPRFWEDYCRGRRGRDYPLGIQWTGPFSSLRDWMGLHGLGAALQSDRGWVAEMVSYLGDFVTQAARRAVQDVDLDFAVIREPWACRLGVVSSTDAFRQVFAPYYRQVIGYLREGGVSAIIIEARGQVGQLIPEWLASGVNGLAYLEAGAGLDARVLRRQYGKELALIGNLDHQALAGQRRDIADEVLGKVPALLEQGGYFPAPDRPVPSDVFFEDYEYYLSLLRRLG